MIIDKEIIRELAQCAQNLLDMEEEAGIGPDLENPEHEDGHEYHSRMLYEALAEFNAAVRLDEDHNLETSTTSPYA